jgi:hypothetical protein
MPRFRRRPRRPILSIMDNRFNQVAPQSGAARQALTLSGDRLDRIEQALAVAAQQITLGQADVDDYRIEDALLIAQEALDSARTRIANAVEAVREDQEASGEAERQRQKWRPAVLSA